jgi:outer membrane protein assembly factor BamB
MRPFDMLVAPVASSDAPALHVRWRTRLSAVADSAPVYLSGKLYITAKTGTTYALDGSTGKILWRFVTHGPNITTAAPAADAATRRIYAAGVDGAVHKLDAATGSELRGGGFPARITLMPQTEKLASALNIANGYLYAVTSGYFGDAPPYVGHVVSIRLRDGARHVFNTLCSELRSLPAAATCPHNGSGMWSRAGAVVDPDSAMQGRVYVVTGNGDFNADRGGHDYGDSILALKADGSGLVGYYTPENYDELERGDVDLGSSSVALLPREAQSKTPLMLVQAGKEGMMTLLDRSNLHGLDSELQRIDIGSGLYSTPAVRRDATGRTWVYLGLADGVRAYRLQTENRNSRLLHAWTASVGQTEEGTSPVVSGGTVFAALDGALYALDARSGRTLSKGTIGNVHWQSPLVINGWLYCADQDGMLTAFSVM